MSLLFARAIHAAVFGAGGAGSQKLFAESCPGAVQANVRSGNGETVLLGVVADALLSEIDGAESFGVLRLETVQNAMKAGADLVLEVRR
jgi:hypothetical protein